MTHPKKWTFPRMAFGQYCQLLGRALAQEIKLSEDPEMPSLFAIATSGTEPGKTYRVNEYVCTCPAGENGMPCKHRALFLHEYRDVLGQGFFTKEEEKSWTPSDDTSDSSDSC